MKPLEIVFLGTSCSNPTTNRHLTSTAFRFNGVWFLVDCAENVQKQMLVAGISYMKVQYILFSHYHLDHFLGLAGLLATMSLHKREEELVIFGPKGLKEKVKQAIDLGDLELSFPLDLQEIKKDKIILDKEDFKIKAFHLDHTVKTLGYCFKEKDKIGEFEPKKAEDLGIPKTPYWNQLQKGITINYKGKRIKPEDVMDLRKAEKGKKLCIVMDTFSSTDYKSEIFEADVLVHEASFLKKDAKRAEETKHSVVEEVAKLAAESKVKKLFLTHISPRYPNSKDIENEARRYFKESYVAKDLQREFFK